MRTTSNRSLRRLRALAVVQATLLLVALGVPAAALAADGDGTVTVSPTSVLTGSTGNTLTFVHTVGASWGGSSNAVHLRITVPGGGWSAPTTGGGASTPGHVAIASESCSGSLSIAVSGGSNIDISGDSDNCNNGDVVTITYFATAGTTIGANTFTSSTRTNSYNGSLQTIATSPVVTVTAPKVDTTTVVTSDTPDPSNVGVAYAVNVSVARASGSASITGNVVVSDGTDSCTDTTASGGSAATVTYSCNLTSTTAGAKTLTATYAGNASFNGSSGTADHTVNGIGTTTTITSDTPDPTYVGGAYTVSVSVTRASGSATITGTMNVSDGTDSCTDATTSGGSAATVTYSCSLTSTTSGLKTLTATYPGNATFNGSSGTATHTVNSVDGNGTMTAVYSEVGSTTPSAIPITPGKDLELIDFTFTAGAGGLPAGSQLQFVIPAGWTAPTKTAGTDGAMTVLSRTCSAPATGTAGFTIAGSGPWTITITAPVCTAGQNIVIRYGNAANVYVTAPNARGDYEFTTSTAGPGGTLTGIASQPELTVIGIAQAALSITGPATKTFGDSAFAPTTSGGSGSGAVTFTSTTPSVCTASDSANVTIVGVGTCTVTATKAGDSTYNPTTSAPYDITVAKADTVTVIDCSGTFTYTGAAQTPCTATVTGPGLNAPVDVDYLDNTDAGTASASADYAGSANYNASSDTESFDIAKADPVCAVSGWSGTYDGSAHGASGSCTGVNDETLAGLALGSSFTDVPGGTANWVYTDATGNYNDDSGSVDISIAKADPVCAVSGWSGTYDGSAHGASGSCTGVNDETLAGLALGSSFTDVPGGTANWVYTDATGNYNDDSGSVDISIAKADPVCTINGYDGPFDGFAHGATGTCRGVEDEVLPGLDLGASFTDVPGGTADWVFTDATGNYTDDAGSVDISIGKTAQVIDFPEMPNVNDGATSFQLAATTDSGLPITYTSLTPNVCTVSGTTVTIVGVGTCTIEASQPGDENYAPAGSVLQSFEVRAADSTTPETNTTAALAAAGDSGPIPPALFLGLLTVGVLGTLLVLLGFRARRDGMLPGDRER